MTRLVTTIAAILVSLSQIAYGQALTRGTGSQVEPAQGIVLPRISDSGGPCCQNCLCPPTTAPSPKSTKQGSGNRPRPRPNPTEHPLDKVE